MSGLPTGWVETSIGEVTKPFENIDPGRLPEMWVDYIDIGSIDNATQRIADPKRFIGRDAPSRARRLVKTGDVLFSTVRTYLKNIARVPPELDGALTSTGIALLRPSEALESSYLFHWVCSAPFLETISKKQDGTMYPAVSDRDVSAASITLPPLAEQRRIVAKLDALTACTARARAELNRIPPLAARYKQAVLAQAFSGELTAEWRQVAGSQTAVSPRASSDIRAKYRSNESDTSFSPPYDLPTAWAWLRLPEIGDMDRGKSRHRPRDDERLFGGPYPFIQTGDVRAADRYLTAYSRTYSEFGLDQSRLWPASTVCITIAANIAETAILGVDACFPDSVVGFTADSGRCIPEYVEYFIRTAKADLEQFAPATAQKNINLEVLASVRLPVAPLSEQAEIVCRIDRAFLEIDRMTTEATSARRLLDRLDQAVLAKAFRGKLVPQDPTDEHASVLLERIKAEREAASKVNRGEKTYKTRRTKDLKIMTKTLEQVLAEAGDWISAQDAFRECGIGGASTTEEIEKIYAELRQIDKAGRLATEPVNDDRSRKLHDRLRLKVA